MLILIELLLKLQKVYSIKEFGVINILIKSN